MSGLQELFNRIDDLTTVNQRLVRERDRYKTALENSNEKTQALSKYIEQKNWTAIEAVIVEMLLAVAAQRNSNE